MIIPGMLQTQPQQPAYGPPIHNLPFLASIVNSFDLWDPAKSHYVRTVPAEDGKPAGKVAIHQGVGVSGMDPWSDPRPYVVICSIYPSPKQTGPTDFYSHQGRPVYCFEGAPRGEFRSMRVYAGIETTRDVLDDANGETKSSREVPPNVVVYEVLKTLAFGIPGTGPDSAPGFKIIAGDVPTTEEWRALQQQQISHFQAKVREADGWHFSTNLTLRSAIGTQHLDAADALGVGDPAIHPWYHRSGNVITKSCRACGAVIPAKMLVHKDCGTNLIEYTLAYGLDRRSLEALRASMKTLYLEDPTLAGYVQQQLDNQAAMAAAPVQAAPLPTQAPVQAAPAQAQAPPQPQAPPSNSGGIPPSSTSTQKK
jgi:hypothetical protein